MVQSVVPFGSPVHSGVLSLAALVVPQGAANAADVAPASASTASASLARASVGIAGLEHGPMPAVKGKSDT
jgi:hypothetical protein